MALTDKLSAIGDAIREKTGSTELLTLDAMPTAISSITTGSGSGETIEGVVITQEEFEESRNSTDLFMDFPFQTILQSSADKGWILNLTNSLKYTFQGCGEVTKLPDIVVTNGYEYSNTAVGTFQYCYKLQYLPNITVDYPIKATNLRVLFASCSSLLEMPENYWDIYNLENSDVYCNGIWQYCTKIKNIYYPPILFDGSTMSYNSSMYYNMASSCACIKKITNIPVYTATWTSNAFNNTFMDCSMLSEVTFYDGDNKNLPTWKNQTISLNEHVGYVYYSNYAEALAEEYGADKEVTDVTSYEALKNDDYWTKLPEYSRYNHDSAVKTINSLPTIYQGSSNVIQFLGESGSATDGGAINTLTTAEIAVATNKGWTVSLV